MKKRGVFFFKHHVVVH